MKKTILLLLFAISASFIFAQTATIRLEMPATPPNPGEDFMVSIMLDVLDYPGYPLNGGIPTLKSGQMGINFDPAVLTPLMTVPPPPPPKWYFNLNQMFVDYSASPAAAYPFPGDLRFVSYTTFAPGMDPSLYGTGTLPMKLWDIKFNYIGGDINIWFGQTNTSDGAILETKSDKLGSIVSYWTAWNDAAYAMTYVNVVTTPTGPTTAPPLPTQDPVDVISIYSDAYVNLPGTDFNPNWGQSTIVTIDEVIAGNNTLKYENLDFQGTQFTNQDISQFENLHVDFWTPNSTDLGIYLISPGNEIEYVFTIVPGTWMSVDIPLSNFTPPVNLTDVFQFKVEGNGTIWFDNWYFWKTPTAPGTDATLSDLQVDGITVAGFSPTDLSYDVELPYGTTVVPTVTATTNDPNASFIINVASSLPGTSEVVVTAQDGITILTYSINFTVAGPEPTTAPPVPTHNEEDVISIYSDAYSNLPGTNYNPSWGQSTVVTVDYLIAGNNTLRYEGLNYQGTEYTNQDVSEYEYLHVDFWTANSTDLGIYLISTGPAEKEYVFTIVPETWVSVDIPLTDFVPPVNLSDVFQFKVEGNGDIWFDNLYFWKSSSTLELCIPEYTTGCALGDGFTDFAIEQIENYDSDCENLNGTGWSQYLELGPAVLTAGQSYDLIVSSGYTGNFVSIWIDFNDDGILLEDERVLENYWIQLANQLYTVALDIPAGANLGLHYMRARTNFANFCDDPCELYAYGEAEDYYVEIIDGGTTNAIFEDDFESYNVGDQLACSNSAWTTWSNTPCSTEDPFIVDNGGSNVVEITGVNDCVYAMPNYTSGFYTMTFDMYIPTGFDGYFNTLQSFAGASSAWGMQAYFYSGAGSVDAGGAGAATFIYPYDTWMAMQVDVDLDADWAEFFIDGTLIVGWQWSTGTFGTGTLNQLGGNNFYAGGDVQAPKYHIDNYVLEAPGTGPVVIFEDDFEAYTAGQQVACQNPTDWTTWSNLPCDATEDAYISDAFAYSGNNSAVIAQNNDLVKNLDTYLTSGAYTASQMVYIPTGFDGYYNAMSDFDGGYEWGFEVYFNVGGDGSVNGGATGAATFTYNHDVWMLCELNIDLDADLAEFYIDGTLIHSWQWTLGAAGGGAQLQLAAFDFFGATATTQMYFDDFSIQGFAPPPPPPGPTNVTAVANTNDVHVSWNAPAQGSGYSDDFEAYDDFVIDFSPWTNIDVDGSATYGMTGITWPNVYLEQAFMIFNPSTTTPAVTDIVPHSGNKIAACFAATTPDNNDWLVSPMTMIESGASVNFWAKSYTADYGLERFTVGVSTTGLDPADFTIITPGSYVEAPVADWTEFNYSLDSYAGQSVYVAIHCVSSDAFIFLVDDFDIGVSKSAIVYNPTKPMTGTATKNVMPANYQPLEKAISQTKSIEALLGYNVYRDGANIGYVAAPTTFYDDNDLPDGTYVYCVTAVYDEGESNEECADPVSIVTAPPPGPINLVGPGIVTVYDDVDLTWDVPGNDWIQWDAGTNSGNGIGLTNGGTFNVSAHWTPAQLANYSGLTVTQMSFFPNADAAATFVLKAWTGAAGNVEIMNQTVTSFTVDQFNEVVLTSPFVIDGSTDLWIGYAVTHGAGTFPAGCDDGPAVPYNGDMINLGGAAWVSMSTDYGLDYNWNLAAYVEFLDGKTAQLGKVVDFGAANGASVVASGSTGEIVKFVPSSVKDFINFKIYRKYNNGSFASIGTSLVPSYTDVSVSPAGPYYYYVTAVWDAGESNPSNTILVDVVTGIEDILFNSTQIFPNPATDVVNIKSDYTIESVTVYNYAGQVVVSEIVNNKIYQVNTSEYQAGIYFFQIDTKEGRISKRVIIK